MNNGAAFALLCLGMFAPSVAADIYRCKLPDGRVAYQATPCSVGEQKAVDDRKARAQLAQKVRKEEEDRKAKKK
jgi:hypothetical protein